MTVWFFDVGKLLTFLYLQDRSQDWWAEKAVIYIAIRKKQRKIMTAQWQPSVIMFRAPYMTESPTPKWINVSLTCSRFFSRKAAWHSGNALESHCLGFRSCHTNWLALAKWPGRDGGGGATLHPSTLCSNIKLPELWGLSKVMWE